MCMYDVSIMFMYNVCGHVYVCMIVYMYIYCVCIYACVCMIVYMCVLNSRWEGSCWYWWA